MKNSYLKMRSPSHFVLIKRALMLTLLLLMGGASITEAWAVGARFLVGDFPNDRILSYDATTGAFMRVFVPTGSGGLNGLQNLVIGPDGNIYVSSHGNASVKRYSGKTGAFIDTFVAPGSGGLDHPDQVAFGPDGHLYVSSRFTATIKRYNAWTGAFMGTVVSDSRLFGFTGFTFGPDGAIYATEFNGPLDILRCTIRTRGTGTCNVFARPGRGFFANGTGITFGPDGNLYVSGINSDNVLRFNGVTGAFMGVFIPVGSGGLDAPDYLTFGPDDNLYVASLGTSSVLRFNGTTGAFINTFASGHGLALPKGVIFPDLYCFGFPATIKGTAGSQTINGTAGNDVIVGLGGNDIINGLGGQDRICGGIGADTLNGGVGIDRLSGQADDDILNGGDNNDLLVGISGNDRLNGDSGNDLLFGGIGIDALNGGSGDDACNVGLPGSGETTVNCDAFTMGGEDMIITSSTTLSGRLVNIGRFEVKPGVIVTVAPSGASSSARLNVVLPPSDGSLSIEADTIQVDGTISADGAGRVGRVVSGTTGGGFAGARGFVKYSVTPPFPRRLLSVLLATAGSPGEAPLAASPNDGLGGGPGAPANMVFQDPFGRIFFIGNDRPSSRSGSSGGTGGPGGYDAPGVNSDTSTDFSLEIGGGGGSGGGGGGAGTGEPANPCPTFSSDNTNGGSGDGGRGGSGGTGGGTISLTAVSSAVVGATGAVSARGTGGSAGGNGSEIRTHTCNGLSGNLPLNPREFGGNGGNGGSGGGGGVLLRGSEVTIGGAVSVSGGPGGTIKLFADTLNNTGTLNFGRLLTADRAGN